MHAGPPAPESSPVTAKMEIATTPWNLKAPHDLDALCEQAVIAQDMGLHSFWLPENHFRADYCVPAPTLLLAAIAARTSTIGLGCVSYLLPIRNPLLAAEEIAVLDHLCGGRLILGLGRGLQPEMFEAFGINSGDKRELFYSTLAAMRKAWAGEPVAHTSGGKAVKLSPLPVQQPSPPLWAAAMGPKALRQIAELGLPYLASPLEPFARLQENYANYRRILAQAELAPVAAAPVMRSVFICDRDQQADAVKAALIKLLPASWRASAEPVDHWAIVGTPGFVEEKLGRYKEELGVTHIIVRSGLPGVEVEDEIRSLEHLLTLAP